MATIYIPIEVPDDKLAAFIADTSIAVLAPSQATPTSAAAPAPATDASVPTAGQTASQTPADPWASQTTVVATPTAPARTKPSCQHGERVFRDAGVSKAGRPYPAFWGCPAASDDPTKCKGVAA